MFRRFLLLIVLLFIACDDGDIITVQLEFDKDLERCDNDSTSFLLYDTKADPSEALILIIPKANNEVLFTEATTAGTPTERDIDGTNVRFIYRTYNRSLVTGTNSDLCEVVPPEDLTIQNSYEATTGTVEITSTIVDDDGDGIASIDEGADPNGDGDFSDSLDTDGDGIYNYIDKDDDGDNVYTINELDEANADGDDDPFTNPLDTDGDGTADYLDADDDDDGVLTKLEDEDGQNGPIDDLSENNGVFIPHYLNTEETTPYTFTDYSLGNEYTRTVLVNFVIKDINLEVITTDELIFGTYVNAFTLP